jgi:hypothetical protein
MSVKESVWNGKIPLEIHLDDPDCHLSGPQAAQLPFYTLELRVSYLPLLIPQIRRHFGSFVNAAPLTRHASSGEFDDAEEEKMPSAASRPRSASSLNGLNLDGFFTAVFGEERMALPWHLPLGLVFDLNCSFHLQRSSSCYNALQSLPFKITFHLSPNAHLFAHPRLPLLALSAQVPLEEALTSVYFAALKESDYVRCGSAKNVMNLSRADQVQLWESLKTGQFDRFWRTNAKLTGFQAKAVPLKVWLLSGVGQWQRFALSVRIDENLGVVREWLAGEFGVDWRGAVLCQGVLVPEAVSVQELFSHFCYADNFLHLIVINQ